MAITTLSMVLTVFVLNLHHISDRPVPKWAKKLVLVYMARMLGICVPRNLKKGKNKQKQHRTLGNHVYRRASVRIDTDGDEQTAIIELHPTNTANGERRRLTGSQDDLFNDLGTTSHTFKPAEEHHELDYSKDWRRMAEVFDRLFFWLFLLAIVISTLVLFHPLTDSYLKRLKMPS